MPPALLASRAAAQKRRDTISHGLRRSGRFHLRLQVTLRLLLRKEVIQPLVPQRLPCYDFIPITTHTLDGSLPCGLGHRHRVQTAFMM